MNLTEGQLFTIEALNKIEGFVWPDKAEFAEVDGGRYVYFYSSDDEVHGAISSNRVKDDDDKRVIHAQVTREQFDSVNGWVRNDGNKPVISGDFDLLLADGEAIYFSDISVDRWDWAIPCKGGVAITHWRYHKPTKETEMINPTPYKKRDCIETLIDKRKDAIEQKRIALATLEEAEAKELELMLSIQAWAESYGFDIRVLDESDEVPEVESELVITDWRDLRIGDVVWWSGAGCIDSGEYVVSNVESNDYKGSTAFCVSCAHGLEWVSTKFEKWKFIRRPSK